MSERDKKILLEMMTNRLFRAMQIPRGSAKSLGTLLWTCRAEAYKRTNYILAALDERLTLEG